MDGKMECERLILVSLSLKEMELLLSGGQDFLKKSALTEVIKAAVKHKIERMRQAPKDARPWLSYWLIQEREGGEGVGLIGCKSLPDLDGYVELGYIVAPECRRRGYMTEALTGFLDWLYEHPACSGATLAIRSANLPSWRVAENCGFRFEKMRDIYRIYRYRF